MLITPFLLPSRVASSSSRRTWIEILLVTATSVRPRSSSSRRTWIEIAGWQAPSSGSVRRPPRGGRGLKSSICPSARRSQKSSSSRRTWIEMKKKCPVDTGRLSRPPRGGRGLKSHQLQPLMLSAVGRPPRGGRGLKLSPQPCSYGWEKVVLLAEDVD